MKKILLISLLILLSIIAISCKSDDSIKSTENQKEISKPSLAPNLNDKSQNQKNNPSETKKSGGIFKRVWSDPPTLDPHLVTDGTSYGIVIEIFSGLVKLGSNPSEPIEPDLAESWKISDGGKTYEFKLRDNLKFSNGEPVTTEDIKWSIERSANPDTGSTVAEEFLGDIIGIKDIIDGVSNTASGIVLVDDKIIQIKIDAPKAYFLAKLTYPTAFIVNKSNIQEGGRNWTDNPISTGPFIMKEYKIGQRIRISRNENYWGPPAYLDEVLFNLSGGVSMAMYENDEIDITGVGLSDLERVQDPNEPLNKDLVSVPPSFAVSYIGFNLNEPPFDDLKFRQALNYSVDKQLIAEQVFSNLVKPAYGIMPPGFPGFSSDLSGLQFDLKKAKNLLTESKYGDPNSRPRITVTVPGTGGSPGLTTEVIADMWRQNLGIEVEIQQVEWATYIQDLHRNRLQAFSGLSWQADYPDPSTFIDVLFRSDSALNNGNYDNAQVDKLINEAQTEQDVTKRIKLYNDAEKIIVEEAAWLPLWWGVEAKALVKPWIKDYKFYSMTIPTYQYVWIDKDIY
ncbi:MAG: ABC transporter substrate-binding protein [Chloroflexi bacterium]|nr:ABC transporter substrate-binding protein [Chloroflexota bacterium]|tara:strand:+ start:1226 stop:2923 length:1698 start_codon:yes stop_codon:yes gene_type:complete